MKPRHAACRLSVEPACQTGCRFTYYGSKQPQPNQRLGSIVAVDDHHGQSLQVTSKMSNNVVVVAEKISLRKSQRHPCKNQY